MESALSHASSSSIAQLVTGFVKVVKLMITGDGTNNGVCRFCNGLSSSATLMAELRCGPNETIQLDWAGDHLPATLGIFADTTAGARAHAYWK